MNCRGRAISILLLASTLLWFSKSEAATLGKNQVSVFAHRVEQFALVDGQGGRVL